MTTSTLARLTELGPGSRFDLRRFRMNVIVDAPARGFIENDWVGRAVAVGDAVQLKITVPDGRCVMTTLAQGDLPQDPGILRTLVQHNRIPAGSGVYPCAGVYAVVSTPGSLRVGDRVVVA